MKVIGICKNEHCEYCDLQKQQEVDQENPVCEGCGRRLELVENGKGNGGTEPPKNWKRILIIIASILILGGIVFGVITLVKSCIREKPEPEQEINIPKPPQEISLDKTELKLVGLEVSEQLTAIIPEDADEDKKTVIWKSGDTTVCVVDNNGVVKPVADGNTVVSAYLLNGISATCNVTVEVKNTGRVIDVPKITNEQTSKPPSKSYGTISVSGGTYKGYLENNLPHGMGSITYKIRTLIDSRDPKKRYAEAGQSITGEFKEGHLLYGKLFDSDGKHIETIIIGGAD